MRDFIIEALYNRYNDVKDRYASEIHERCIDDLVEIVADAWVWEWATASTIIDNWLINWEHWTYKGWRTSHMKWNIEDYWIDKFEEIEESLWEYWMFFDRELEEYCSY